jgi:hypothetical protein
MAMRDMFPSDFFFTLSPCFTGRGQG